MFYFLPSLVFFPPSSPSFPPHPAPIPAFFVHLCNQRAALLTFSKLLSIYLKPPDAGVAINLGDTGSCVMPHPPDGLSG